MMNFLRSAMVVFLMCFSHTVHADEADTKNVDVFFISECMASPTSSCVYEALIKGATISAQRGISMVTPHYEYSRRERVDQIIKDLINLGEFEVAEHYALRELAQRELIGKNHKESEAYPLYKQAVSQTADTINTKKRLPIFVRQHSDMRYRRYLEENVYNKIEAGDLESAYDFLNNLKLIDYGGRGEFIFRIDNLGYIKPREYIDALYELSITYADQNEIDKALSLLNRLKDKDFIDKLLNWKKESSDYTGSKGSSFEFLDVMIGAGAGTDSRAIYVSSLADLSKRLIEKGDIKKATEILEKAQSVAAKLDNPSLSQSKALLVLAAAQAQAKNYSRAFENAEEVKKICCEAHAGKKMLVQDKKHYDLALSGIVTGSLTNEAFDKAEEAANKINDPIEKAEVYFELGETYASSGKQKKSLEYAKKLEEFVTGKGLWDFSFKSVLEYPEEKAHFLNNASKLYYLAGDKKKAASLLEKATEIYFPEHGRIMSGAMISHGRKPKFRPLQDILQNYVDQERYEEIPQKIELLGERSFGSVSKAGILFQTAISAAEQGNIQAVEFLVQSINQSQESEPERLRAFYKESVKNGRMKPEEIESNLKKSLTRQETDLLGEKVTNYLEIALKLIKKPEYREEASKYLALSTKALDELKNRNDLDERKYKYIEQAKTSSSFLAKKVILSALFQHEEIIDRQALQMILLPIRGAGQGNGYSFVAKYNGLIELSQLFNQFDFEVEATQLLEYARLMADRVHSYATRSEVPLNEKQINATYAGLAQEYIKHGHFEQAEKVLNAMADTNDRIRVHGTERSIYLIQERWTVDLVIASLKHDNISEAVELQSELSHPLYKQVAIQSILARANDFAEKQVLLEKVNDNLDFSEVIKYAWDDEELMETVSYLLALAKAQYQIGKDSAVQTTLSHVDRVSGAFSLGHRKVQTDILISDFYADIGLNEKAVMYLEEASLAVERAQIQKQELQSAISERLLALDHKDFAMEGLKGEAKNLLGFYERDIASGRGVAKDKIEKLIPVAKSIAEGDGGLDDETRQRIVFYLDNEPLAPYLGDGMHRAHVTGPEISPYENGLAIAKGLEQSNTK